MRFSEFILEAPIRIDLEPIRLRLQKVFDEHQNDRESLIEGLNQEFKSDVISFLVNPKQKTDIDGYTYPDLLDIEIEIRKGYLSIVKDKTLLSRILEVMEHELVHRQQLLKHRATGRYYPQTSPGYDAEAIKNNDDLAAIKYLSDKQEIMALAVQTVTTLRHEGYKDIQIIDMLRRPARWENKIRKSRSHLEAYMERFSTHGRPHAGDPFKRLAKYMIQYINGEQK